MADTRLEFLNVAMSHMGEGGDWTWSTSGLGRGNAWCAAFVIACAKTAGNNILGTAIYGGTFMAGYLVEASVQKGYGTYQLGGHNGGNPSPAAGDLLTYNRGSPTSGSGVFAAQHIGIVYSVSGSTVTTVEGNTSGGKVASHQISASSSEVAVFYRPNWAAVGGSTEGNPSGQLGSTSSGISSGVGGDLYDTITTREDSIMREVGYWNTSSNSLTTSSTKLRCSVINYTTQLGSFMKGAIGGGSSSTSGSFGGVMTGGTNFEQVFNYMVQNGYTKQAAAAACGNLGGEGGLDANGDLVINSTEKGSGSGIGIVQWSYGRKTAFQNYAASVGEPWPSTSLKTQVQYMMMELEGVGVSQCWTWPVYSGKRAWPTQYKGYTEAQYKACTDISLATYLFCIYFESPYYYNSNIDTRVSIAQRVYNSYA